MGSIALQHGIGKTSQSFWVTLLSGVRRYILGADLCRIWKTSMHLNTLEGAPVGERRKGIEITNIGVESSGENIFGHDVDVALSI